MEEQNNMNGDNKVNYMKENSKFIGTIPSEKNTDEFTKEQIESVDKKSSVSLKMNSNELNPAPSDAENNSEDGNSPGIKKIPMISVIITVTSNVTVSNIFNGYGASIRLPRRSRSPSFMNSLGASERFHSPDIRPTLDQGKYFGRPVVPQPFRPVETRGTKKPHESGQSPPLTGIAKRMITTIRYREIIR
ncbi:hypothetical protein CHS0354_024746 [Potamilus streckersoni]|uniref:Uncharacterized protein n=1 Tax=Potamilus streckersoni TaxID=2493646 RepID=A0AAE0VKR0_9BIVA|nr:hypothetical protein CHS0354_024746 [Potamilus streckersoni]